ncbi:VanZ family protein [Salinimicrobium sp. GXAS 041]|uniref:VanZ family protein n=1 Tax=Salinimicrobium sp. GXAS 041 TaxID=3400806 RepID=UPI003C73D253
MKAKLLFLLPALAYTLAITYLSLINLTNTPVSGLGLSDKILHAGAYFVMGILWLLFALFGYNPKNLLIKILVICGLTIGFGIFIEVLQGTLTNYRELDFYDVIANSVGVFFAGMLVWLLKEYLIRLKTKINLFLIKN